MNRKSTLSLALTTLATSMVAVSFMLAAGSAQAGSAHNHKLVKTAITLRTATQIGNTTLTPGKYRVKITPTADASDDPTVQFSILPDYDDELNPTYDDVVVTVQASTVDLTAPAARTKLVPASGDNNKARALEIRDNSTEYVFDDRTASPAKRQ
jgi:hypothetical protein